MVNVFSKSIVRSMLWQPDITLGSFFRRVRNKKSWRRKDLKETGWRRRESVKDRQISMVAAWDRSGEELSSNCMRSAVFVKYVSNLQQLQFSFLADISAVS